MEEVIIQTSDAFAIIPKVQNIQVGYQVVFTEHHVYLINKGGSSGAVIAGSQFGLLGMFLGKKFNERKERKTAEERNGKSLDEIVGEDKKSLKIPYAQIEQYAIKTGFFSRGQNGTRAVHLWSGKVKHMVYVPKDLQPRVAEVLAQKCPGRQKQ
jgi:hypothetical protein